MLLYLNFLILGNLGTFRTYARVTFDTHFFNYSDKWTTPIHHITSVFSTILNSQNIWGTEVTRYATGRFYMSFVPRRILHQDNVLKHPGPVASRYILHTSSKKCETTRASPSTRTQEHHHHHKKYYQ